MNSRKSRKSKRLKIVLTGLGLAVLAVAAYFINLSTYINSEVVLEAGKPMVEANAFSKKQAFPAKFITDVGKIDTFLVGKYPIEVEINKHVYKANLIIQDTVAPKVVAKEVQIWLGETVTKESFINQIDDASKVELAYKQEPNVRQVGEQVVGLVATDGSGNKTEATTKLIVLEDKEPPKIEGAKDIEVYIGKAVAYREGIVVTDNRDKQPVLKIDNTQVDLKKPGQYVLVYSSVDTAGNASEVKVNVTVKVKPADVYTMEDLEPLTDAVISKIIKPGMSEFEKLETIYYWVGRNVKYVGDSDKSNWIKGAYLGLKRGSGDCYTYYAVSKALLTKAGIANVDVERMKGFPTRHYWNLVAYNGSYYHFDTCPYRKGYSFVCFLKTGAEVEAYTKRVPGYYTYDKASMNLPMATEKLKIKRYNIYKNNETTYKGVPY